MGLYDIYAGVQLKVGDDEMKHYEIGDAVDISDGIYVGYEGAVVVKDSVLVAMFEELTDKWGGTIETNQVIEPKNPITP